jgi:glutaminase
MDLSQQLVDDIYGKACQLLGKGKVADYIPALKNVAPKQLAIAVLTIDKILYRAGRADVSFSIQSIAKVFSLAMVFAQKGEDIWQRIGREPSGNPFNSLIQLELENGIPRNPLINAGAIVVCDIMLTLYKDPQSELLAFLHKLSNDNTIDIDPEVLESERETGHRNYALAHFIKSQGNLNNDVQKVLDLYFFQSAIRMNVCQLAAAFAFLANHGRPLYANVQVLTPSQSKRLNAILLTCGFYNEAGEFAYRVGLPGKSGVGGGIAAISPGNYSIGVWSPALNASGNSLVAMDVLEQLTTETGISIF